MSLLPATRTPFTPKELLASLHWAYTSEMGHAPADATLAILCAQAALETKNGARCVQNNPGNFKAGCSADRCEFTTTEYLGTPPVETTMVCAFSAWPSLADGCAYYVHALYTSWPEAWSAAVVGDATAFAAGLKKRDYFTAPLAAYVAGVKRYQGFYLALLGGDDDATLPELPIATLPALAVEAIAGILDPDATLAP